jgi:HAMP domain-containing protein
MEGAASTFNLAGQLLLVLGAAAPLLAAVRTARRTSPTSTHRT